VLEGLNDDDGEEKVASYYAGLGLIVEGLRKLREIQKALTTKG